VADTAAGDLNDDLTGSRRIEVEGDIGVSAWRSTAAVISIGILCFSMGLTGDSRGHRDHVVPEHAGANDVPAVVLCSDSVGDRDAHILE